MVGAKLQGAVVCGKRLRKVPLLPKHIAQVVDGLRVVGPDLPSMTLETGLSIWKGRRRIRRTTRSCPKLPTGSGEKAGPKLIQRWSAARKREIVILNLGALPAS